ncbi:hypothetical protein ELI00_37010 [Rhizobium ruizarguesonis]|uniref:hypothetical protein n=1 Tax=Rhizobium ruizarguesonis TaxID=2081791 RepID=UPI0010318921|nr:hypothetical protein [Rhizobium ruizarguesonis]TAX63549.1 hypothetical protein ELI00_37010 [Rhizobium ruizarguesonis]
MRHLSLSVLWLLGSTVVATTASADDVKEELINGLNISLNTYFFKTVRANPVRSGQAIEVGAVYEITDSGAVLHSRQTDCFPRLALAEPDSWAFPTLVAAQTTAAAASLSASSWGKVFGGVDFRQVSVIKFADATTQSASPVALRKALDQKACPELKGPLWGGTVSAKDHVPQLYIVGTVFRARPEIVFSFVDDRQVGATLQALKLPLASGNLGLSVSAAFGSNNNHSISLIANKPLAVAARPAVVPMQIGSGELGGSTGGKPLETQWAEYNAHNGRRAAALMKFAPVPIGSSSK